MLTTTRMQCRLLHRYFIGGEDVTVEPDQLKQPWREIFFMADRYLPMYAETSGGGAAALRDACNAVAEEEEAAAALYRQIRDLQDEPRFLSLADIEESIPPVDWLWRNWIPRGMLTLLGAYQGTGKSYFVLDLARAVIEGGEWPDGTPAPKGCVVYIDAEGIPSIHVRRSKALGFDRSKLFLQYPGDDIVLDLTQTHWQDRLVEMVTALRPELIIIDSLSSSSSSGQNSTQDTNSLLMFLVALANYGNCGMLLLHHLRKPPAGQLMLPGLNLHDFRGSGHITAMARSVLGMSVSQSGRQFSLNGPRRLDLVKTNVADDGYPDPIGIVQHQEHDGEVVRFEYGEAPDYERSDTHSDDCEQWLIDYLDENGPTRPSKLLPAAEQAGYSRSTIYRVRKEMGDTIVNTKGRQHPQNKWALPGQEDGDDDDSELSTVSTDR